MTDVYVPEEENEWGFVSEEEEEEYTSWLQDIPEAIATIADTALLAHTFLPANKTYSGAKKKSLINMKTLRDYDVLSNLCIDRSGTSYRANKVNKDGRPTFSDHFARFPKFSYAIPVGLRYMSPYTLEEASQLLISQLIFERPPQVVWLNKLPIILPYTCVLITLYKDKSNKNPFSTASLLDSARFYFGFDQIYNQFSEVYDASKVFPNDKVLSYLDQEGLNIKRPVDLSMLLARLLKNFESFINLDEIVSLYKNIVDSTKELKDELIGLHPGQYINMDLDQLGGSISICDIVEQTFGKDDVYTHLTTIEELYGL